MVLVISCQEDKAVWLVDSTGVMNFTVCGTTLFVGKLGTDGIFAIGKDKKPIKYNQTCQKFFIGDEPICWHQLMDSMKDWETEAQGWVLEVEEELIGAEFEGCSYEQMNYGCGWNTYFANCLPVFMYQHERLDPYEGITLKRQEQSNGEEEFFFPCLEELINPKGLAWEDYPSSPHENYGLIAAKWEIKNFHKDSLRILDGIQCYPSLYDIDLTKLVGLLPTDCRCSAEVQKNIREVVRGGDIFNQGWSASTSFEEEAISVTSYNSRLTVRITPQQITLSWSDPTIAHKEWALSLGPSQIAVEQLQIAVVTAAQFKKHQFKWRSKKKVNEDEFKVLFFKSNFEYIDLPNQYIAAEVEAFMAEID